MSDPVLLALAALEDAVNAVTRFSMIMNDHFEGAGMDPTDEWLEYGYTEVKEALLMKFGEEQLAKAMKAPKTKTTKGKS